MVIITKVKVECLIYKANFYYLNDVFHYYNNTTWKQILNDRLKIVINVSFALTFSPLKFESPVIERIH